MMPQDLPNPEAQLEAYLDGLMDPSQRAAFEDALRSRPDLQKEISRQRQLDVSLRRQFAFASGQPSEEQIQAVMSTLTVSRRPSDVIGDPHPRRKRILQMVMVGVAAALFWFVVAWQLGERPVLEPVFQPQPLAQLYREAVARGFEPYYECRDEERFASTFAHRQSRPLQLLEMPAGSGMLGLSYSGGLSRDTTAMLCRVDDEPVMVFVDRQELDVPLAVQNDDPGLHVFREERLGLVLYEVTPFDEARVVDYLVAPEDAPAVPSGNSPQ